MTRLDIYPFLADHRLITLMERVKISDDFLDVVTLSENQHSDMLAWCLDPNEGHGQGDAVIKDFLIAAYKAGLDANKHLNKVFFNKWTPGRIRTSSFGTAFINREFSLAINSQNRKGRLDLFVIDPSNHIVVTIENKVGAALTEAQLDHYYSAVREQIGKRPVFKDYDFVYVVVDKKLDYYDQEYINSLSNKWALLDYSWLQASANRAKLHVERNNEAAQMLMAYCQKQTGWQSPNERDVLELSAELASQYETVVRALYHTRKMKPTDWTPTCFRGVEGELLLFSQQNQQLCNYLFQSRGIGSVRVGLRKALPDLSVQDVEYGRTWLRFSTNHMQSLKSALDEYWPIFINIFREPTKTDEENSKFTIRLIWATDEIREPEFDTDALRTHVAEIYPALKKYSSSAYRRIHIAKGLDAKEALKKSIETAKQVDNLLESARKNGIIK